MAQARPVGPAPMQITSYLSSFIITNQPSGDARDFQDIVRGKRADRRGEHDAEGFAALSRL
jgi:hypothetical protein